MNDNEFTSALIHDEVERLDTHDADQRDRITALDSQLTESDADRHTAWDVAEQRRGRITTLETGLREMLAVIDAQAEDEVLWCEADSIVEAYVQQELRALTEVVECRCRALLGSTTTEATQ